MLRRKQQTAILMLSVLEAAIVVALVIWSDSTFWNNARPGKTEQNSYQSDQSTMLIEPTVLQDMLNKPGIRILDARAEFEFTEAHIPGAVVVNVKSWQDQGKKENGFHDTQAWAEKVGRLGIENDSHVVVYGKNLPDTARIWWTLKYLGLNKVGILNGGWEFWVKENRPTEVISQPVSTTTHFQPRFQHDRLEEIDSLKSAIRSGKATVVDARTTDEFAGKDVRGQRGGHIPGAKHLEWKELLAEDGRFKTTEQLRQLFRNRGIMPDQTAVTC